MKNDQFGKSLKATFAGLLAGASMQNVTVGALATTAWLGSAELSRACAAGGGSGGDSETPSNPADGSSGGGAPNPCGSNNGGDGKTPDQRRQGDSCLVVATDAAKKNGFVTAKLQYWYQHRLSKDGKKVNPVMGDAHENAIPEFKLSDAAVAKAGVPTSVTVNTAVWDAYSKNGKISVYGAEVNHRSLTPSSSVEQQAKALTDVCKLGLRTYAGWTKKYGGGFDQVPVSLGINPARPALIGPK